MRNWLQLEHSQLQDNPSYEAGVVILSKQTRGAAAAGTCATCAVTPMHTNITHQQQQLSLTTTMHTTAAGNDVACSHSVRGSYSRSNSNSRAASRAGHSQEAPSVPSRPHSRLAQQFDTCCIVKQHQQLQHLAGMPAGHRYSNSGSSADEQGYMPGQMQRPGSRLGHHTDMHSLEKQQQQQQQGYASRQHSSRGAHVSSSSSSSNNEETGTTLTTPDTPQISTMRSGRRPKSGKQQQQQYAGHAASYELSAGSDVQHMSAIPERPCRSTSMHQQCQQQQAAPTRCANPLFTNNSCAAALLAGNAAPAAAAAAGSASRASSAAGVLRDRSSPVMTPRRTAGSYAGVVNSNVCPASGAVNSSCTRPGSSSSSRRDPGGNFVSSTTTRNETPGYVSNKQQSAIPYSANSTASSRPYSAGKQGSRPGSSAGRPSSQQQQQRSCSRSQALPAGALSQDPAPAAARPGAVYLQNNSSSSSSSMTKSRPGSAARQPAAAAASFAELRCSSRQQQQQQQPYRPRQQSAVGATAASTPSVLAATPRNRPASTSSHRPGSAAAKSSNSRQQQQQHGEAQGPLLSQYFWPLSAAAPGSISMFGLPDMEPPGGLAGAAPSVKVPSVHASWDAGVGGLLSVSSSSSCALASPKAGSASAAGLAAATAAAALCSQLDCKDAGHLQQQQQQRKKAQARPGTKPTSTWADHDETPGGHGSAQNAARPDSSRCVRRPGSAAVDRDTAEAPGVQQLLLWSAAHEIDGRPVTRNGERARHQSRGIAVE